MEDWEAFFVEKSTRRADKERREMRRRQTEGWIAAAVIAALIVAGIFGLALTRP
jgi:hypothetical protein